MQGEVYIKELGFIGSRYYAKREIEKRFYEGKHIPLTLNMLCKKHKLTLTDAQGYYEDRIETIEEFRSALDALLRLSNQSSRKEKEC